MLNDLKSNDNIFIKKIMFIWKFIKKKSKKIKF